MIERNPKVICTTDKEPRLTKDKTYEVYNIYFDTYYIENDRHWKKYYPKDYFQIL